MKNRDTGTDPVILVKWEKNFTTKQKIDGCKAKLEEIAKLQPVFSYAILSGVLVAWSVSPRALARYAIGTGLTGWTIIRHSKDALGLFTGPILKRPFK